MEMIGVVLVPLPVLFEVPPPEGLPPPVFAPVFGTAPPGPPPPLHAAKAKMAAEAMSRAARLKVPMMFPRYFYCSGFMDSPALSLNKRQQLKTALRMMQAALPPFRYVNRSNI
jgi:hypothetical protein